MKGIVHEAETEHDGKRDLSAPGHAQAPHHGHGQDDHRNVYQHVDDRLPEGG